MKHSENVCIQIKDTNLITHSVSTESVEIFWKNQVILGNNRQILLDQLEHAGVYVPYSCRTGICGFCQVKLIRGKVNVLKPSAIGNSNIILCCSCIPQTSLQLET